MVGTGQGDDILFGLDLDGVWYNFCKTANWMLRRRIEEKGARPPECLYRPWNYWSEPIENTNPADWEWLWTDGVKKGLFRYGHVIEGAIEGVQELCEIGRVAVVTHRPAAAVHDTLAWLAFMGDKAPLSGVVFQSNGEKKSEVTPRPDVYIDDATHVARDILDNTDSQVILFDSPENQDFDPQQYPWASARHRRVVRARDWPAVVKIAKQIKEARHG